MIRGADSGQQERTSTQEARLGTLIVTEFMTLDGVGQSPGAPDEDREDGFPYGGWQAPLESSEYDGVVFEVASRMDALLMGRKTYEIFADYWPVAPEAIPFTGLFNRVPKYVASSTLDEPLSWEGTHVLSGDIAESVGTLKERHDEVHLFGSLNLVQSLLAAGLVDRLHLWQYPIVLGTGKRIFAEGTVPTLMTLSDSKIYGNGLLHLVYEPAGPPTFAREDAEYWDQ